MGTDSSQKAVSNLDFEPRKIREFQNSSRGVRTKVLTPPAQRPNFLCPEARVLVIFCFLGELFDDFINNKKYYFKLVVILCIKN
ncbi:hypothetical protein CPR19088_GLDEOEPO_01796 [Companilactobacillus paralimentarius]